MNDTVVLGDPAFYVLRNDNLDPPNNYYNGSDFDSTLQSTRSHYDRTVGAQKDVTKLERLGYDCDNLVILPIFVTAGQPIKPKLRPQKTGFVLEITIAKDPKAKPGYRGAKDQVYYWKGNKKKPMDHYAVDDGVPQTITASIFKTKQEADDKLAEWSKMYKEREAYLIHQEKENHARWLSSWEQRHGQKYSPNDWAIKELSRMTCKVVDV